MNVHNATQLNPSFNNVRKYRSIRALLQKRLQVYHLDYTKKLDHSNCVRIERNLRPKTFVVKQQNVRRRDILHLRDSARKIKFCSSKYYVSRNDFWASFTIIRFPNIPVFEIHFLLYNLFTHCLPATVFCQSNVYE